MLKYLIFINIIIFIFPLPVAILHGFYDSCENAYFASLVNVIKYNIGDYSKCIETGAGQDSWSLSMEKQAEIACNEIKNNPKFNGDFSIFSISQGGLLARYIIQKCDMKGKVKKLVSFGGPMMGTSQVPFCLGGVICYIINSLVDYFIYDKSIQKGIGPAGYYRTAAHIDDYKESKSFLVKLNNENEDEFDQKGKDRFEKLESLMLIGFENDKMISPKQTAEFWVYNEKFELIPMNQTEVYEKNLFGLKTLDEDNKIHVHYLKGEHTEFDFNDVVRYAIPYL
jgi:palmitoyl-protein thioesterase